MCDEGRKPLIQWGYTEKELYISNTVKGNQVLLLLSAIDAIVVDNQDKGMEQCATRDLLGNHGE